MRKNKESAEKKPKHELVVRLGKAIGDVRKHKHLTLGAVMLYVYDELLKMYGTLSGKDDWIGHELSAFADAVKLENWLAKLERGEIAKPPRLILDLLIDAMECNLEERTKILCAGGYHPFPYVRKTKSLNGFSSQKDNQDEEFVIFDEHLDQATLILIEVMLAIYEPACLLIRRILKKDRRALHDIGSRLIFVRAVIDLALEELKDL